MSSFGFGTGFGASQPAASPFGASAPSPFGASQPVFGQQSSSPFGASSSASLFGSSTPAFGAGQTPAFGASSAAFGATGFGARPSGGQFGAFGQTQTPNPFSSQPAFGAPSTPAFGAQSTPAFGAQPFGASAASPFGGGSAFGSSTPAFGSTGFGASSSPAFGSTGFGTGFGQQQQQQPGFGMQQQQGTKHINYQKVAEQEGGSGTSSRTTVHFCSVMALPQYRDSNEKSPLELRWEDYQAGVKGNTGGLSTAGGFGQTPGGFGSPAQSSPFGGTPLFGQASTPAFGQASTPAFGQASTPAFGGGFGQTTSAFGASTPSLFGKPASSPAFGQSSSPFGSTSFGVASTPAFGQTGSVFGAASTPAFGQTAAAFGSTGFGTSFGASTPAFGTPQSASAFGGGGLFGGGATSQPAFGASTSGFSFSQASSSAFSFPSSAPAFGQAPTPQPFGAGSSGGFSFGGQTASTPAFGGGGLFGQTASKPFGSTFGASQPFGGSTPSPFGANTGGGLFGGPASSAAFGGGGLFGASQSTGASLFSFAQQQPQGQQQQQLVQLPGISTSPYGTLPPAPQVGAEAGPPIAEYRVGLSQQPVTGLLSSRTLALLSSRTLTPRAGISARPMSSRSRTTQRFGANSADTMKPSDSGAETASIFVPRENPRLFFVRESLPDTSAAATSGVSRAHSQQRTSTEDQATSGGEPLRTNGAARSGFSPLPEASPRRGNKPGASPSSTPGEQSRRDAGSDAEDKAPERQPAPSYLSDSQISRLLPKVTKPDVYIEPSLTQLAAMAREDEQSLEHVANFKVGHRRYGSVVWREPVDVRGIDIDRAVAFSKSSVEVYLNDVRKPSIGEGLNRPAEVTLLNIFKTDKATGSPTVDPAAVEKFVKRLKRVTAAQSARFVDYQADTGVWRFQVDHFSKYGLLHESDSEEEATTTGPPAPEPPGDEAAFRALTASVTQSDEAVGMQEGDEVDGPLGEMREMEVESVVPGAARAAASPILSHALPARLELDPSELAGLRDTLYGEAGEAPPQRPPKRRTVDGVVPLHREGSLRAKVTGREPVAPPGAERTPHAPRTAPTAWTKHPSAIAPPSRQLPGLASLGIEVLPELASQACLVVSGPKSAESANARNLVDAGAALGHSSRAGWGPNNLYIHSGALRSRGRASDVILNRIRLEAAGADDRRARWQALLELHAKRSSPESPAEDAEGEAPQWSLKCTVDDLQALCSSFIDAYKSEESRADRSIADVCAKQEVQDWELVSVLFGSIASKQPAAVAGSPEEDLAGGEAVEAASSTLISFKRRAGISNWLRQCAAPKVDEALSSGGSLLRKIAILLTGQRLLAAAALASASGNVRLATLITQAGAAAEGRADVARQLSLWKRNGLDEHMDPELLNIYHLLAGDPAPVIRNLGLDWRRAFGLHFWYATASDAPLEKALRSYTDAATQAKTAPNPMPLYAEKHGWSEGQRRAPDLAFTLLQLATGRLSASNPMDVAQLLSPEAHTPEPLDALHGWLLLQTLRAIGAINPTLPVLHQELMLASDVISQLHSVGGLPEWEVYVAMHMPTFPHPDQQNARSHAVSELLIRNARHWAEDPSKRDFLHTLQLPKPWLANALAVFARNSWDSAEELEQLMAAGQWGAAHQLLLDRLAPGWLLVGGQDREKLQRVLQKLEEHAAEVSAAGGVSFKAGAGLYATYVLLQEIEETEDGEGEDTELMGYLTHFTRHLSEAAALPWTKSQGVAHNQVLSKMAGDAARWLVGRRALTGEELIGRERMILGLAPLLPALRQSNLQLSAVALAEAFAG